MSEENKVPPEGSGNSAEDSWREVGRQFEVLGDSLAQAVRTAWENEQTQRRVQEMRNGLESMVREVGRAIDESTQSPQGQQVKQEAQRAADSFRVATDKTIQDVRPQLIDALEKLNHELEKLVNRMNQSGGRASTQSVPPEEKGPGSPQ